LGRRTRVKTTGKLEGKKKEKLANFFLIWRFLGNFFNGKSLELIWKSNFG
jgi:hypothetical protein